MVILEEVYEWANVRVTLDYLPFHPIAGCQFRIRGTVEVLGRY